MRVTITTVDKGEKSPFVGKFKREQFEGVKSVSHAMAGVFVHFYNGETLFFCEFDYAFLKSETREDRNGNRWN